jgi:hypothetical protein
LCSIRSTRRHRRLPMTIWNPRQIATKHVDGQGRCHENRSYPEAPVTMHASPVGPWIGFASAVTVPFGVMLVSSHYLSISGEYSPLRAALLQSACCSHPSQAGPCDRRRAASRSLSEFANSFEPVCFLLQFRLSRAIIVLSKTGRRRVRSILTRTPDCSLFRKALAVCLGGFIHNRCSWYCSISHYLPPLDTSCVQCKTGIVCNFDRMQTVLPFTIQP